MLRLNDEPPRRFRPYSESAEEICIQVSSVVNARYRVGVQVPYQDPLTAAEGKLIYPSPEAGMLREKRAHRPGSDSAQTLPPCSSIASLQR